MGTQNEHNVLFLEFVSLKNRKKEGKDKDKTNC